MLQKNLFLLLTLLVFKTSAAEVLDVYDNIHHPLNANKSNEISEKPLHWFKSVQNMIGTPTGRVVVQVAKELLNRSAGNSQVRSEVVLSLNLTNLLIILLLKILIFTAGVLGAGHWGGGYGYGYNYARSLSTASTFAVNDGEGQLITGFLTAQGSGMDDCLYLAACANPQVAYEYFRAAKAVLEGVEKFQGSSITNTRYKDLIDLMYKGSEDGFRGSTCNKANNCNSLQ